MGSRNPSDAQHGAGQVSGKIKLWFEVEYRPPKRQDVSIKVVGPGLKELGKGGMHCYNHTLEHDTTFALDFFRSCPRPLEVDSAWLAKKEGKLFYKYYSWDNEAGAIIEDETDIENRLLTLDMSKLPDGSEVCVKDYKFRDLSRPQRTEISPPKITNPYEAFEKPFAYSDEDEL